MSSRAPGIRALGWRAGLLRAGLLEIPLDGRIALAAAGFADLHRDPADRFIAASAGVRNATLVTADEKLLAWKASRPRLDARRRTGALLHVRNKKVWNVVFSRYGACKAGGRFAESPQLLAREVSRAEAGAAVSTSNLRRNICRRN